VKTDALRGTLAGVVAATLLAACGAHPGGGIVPAGVTANASWMLPEVRGDNLLYVSEQYIGTTFVYTYPQGRLVGGIAIPGSPDYVGGLCSNPAGDVFITSESGIYEFPHGRARPIAVLGDPEGPAYGCSIDPTTGNLAAITPGGGVAIYRPATRDRWHLPKLFDLNSDVQFGGYDGSGDLFVDGTTSGNQNFFLELPKGSSSFETVTLNVSVAKPGNIEWDGKYLDIGDNDDLLIHRFAISGTQGEQVGSLTLEGSNQVGQFWIQGDTIIGPSYNDGYYIGFWKYPRGGSAKRTIQQSEAYGATVSRAS
jgi:hypothetical protein